MFDSIFDTLRICLYNRCIYSYQPYVKNLFVYTFDILFRHGSQTVAAYSRTDLTIQCTCSSIFVIAGIIFLPRYFAALSDTLFRSPNTKIVLIVFRSELY